MREKKFQLVALVAIVLGTFGCATQSNTNVADANQNKLPANTNQPVTTSSIAAGETVDPTLATPADAYRTAYALRQKKDVAGLKQVLSKDVLDFLTLMGEGDKLTLDQEVARMFERPQGKSNATRNVKISGDRATLEYVGELGDWKSMDFVKEDGVWKMAMPAKDDIKVESGTNKP